MHPQRSFADVEYDGQPRQTRRERFLQRMEALMPWARLEARIRFRSPPASAVGPRIRWPCGCDSLRATVLQPDPAMEDALYDSVAGSACVTARDPRPVDPPLRRTAPLGEGLLAAITQRLAAQGLRLREGTIVDATILDAPASTEPRPGARPGDAPGEEGQPVVLRDEGA